MAAKIYSLHGVGHTVRPHGAHHAQLLQRVFVLPFLRKLLLLGRLALDELLPALRRAFDVAVEVLELVRVRQRLRTDAVTQRNANENRLHTNVFLPRCSYAGAV